MSGTERILVVGPAWVGDMVMAQALYKLLKQRSPDSEIDVLAPAWSLPLLERMPEVHRGIEIPLGHGQFGLNARYQLGKQLRKEAYDRAIVLPRSFKSALSPYFARAKQRTGYRGEMRYGLINDMRQLDKSVLRKTVERYVALGMECNEPLPPAAISNPALQVNRDNLERLLSQHQLDANSAVALLPGAAYGPAKQWPITHWAALAKKLRGKGKSVWILGSDADSQTAEQIIDGAGGVGSVRNLCGVTSLTDAVDLLSVCRAAVSNDSGLMHVAAAVGIPVIGIYGSSTPDYTPPLSDKAQVVYRALECSPCFKRECPYGHTECLTEISTEQVFERLQPMIEESRQ